jgi:site-specific DNA-cytosine methylase
VRNNTPFPKHNLVLDTDFVFEWLRTLRDQNYNVKVTYVNGFDLGVPQLRERIYVVALCKNVSSEMTLNEVSAMYARFVLHDESQCMPLDRFLLPEDHPMVEEELRRISSNKLSSKPMAKAPKKPRNVWIEKSIQDALSTSILTGQTWGLNQWDDPTVAASHPWWHVLTAREQDIAILHEVDGRDMVADLTQAPDRGKVTAKSSQFAETGWGPIHIIFTFVGS